ncbi:hypothetical protein GGF31_001040 [Allomyces arbusculus]|nr:hypothetical protein GGF31_001040 [Allomyces arbusculus]
MPFELVADALSATKNAARAAAPIGSIVNVTVADKQSYDASIMAACDQRKFNDAVFLGVQAGDLKTTTDYISAIKGVLLRHNVMKQYLGVNAMPAPMDNLGLNGVTHAIFVCRVAQIAHEWAGGNPFTNTFEK